MNNKQIAKIAIYYTDGTYQEVTPMPFPFTDSVNDPTQVKPVIPAPDWNIPGQIGKWPFPPPGTGKDIID